MKRFGFLLLVVGHDAKAIKAELWHDWAFEHEDDILQAGMNGEGLILPGDERLALIM